MFHIDKWLTFNGDNGIVRISLVTVVCIDLLLMVAKLRTVFTGLETTLLMVVKIALMFTSLVTLITNGSIYVH